MSAKFPDDADRAKSGTLPDNPSDGTERARRGWTPRVAGTDERRPDEPCALEAERALLGALLWAGANQPQTLRVAAVRDIIDSGEQFYNRRAGAIFDAIRACADAQQEHEPVAVHQELVRKGVAGRLEDLRALLDDASTVNERQARVYAQAIRDTWARRKVIQDARGLIEDAKAGKTPAAELLTKAQAVAKQLAERASTGAGVVSIKESAFALFTVLKSQKCEAAPTGLRDLDRALNGGLRPGETSVIAARTNVGKSALSAGIARHIASAVAKTGVLYVTLEMQHISFTARLVSAQAGVPLSAIRRLEIAEHEGKLLGALDRLKTEELYFADNPTQTMAAIYASAMDCSRRLARSEKKLALVVIDHIGLVKPSAEALKKASREQQVAETSRAMRYIAQDLNCHVIGLAQIGRAAEKDGTERMPKLHHLRESGSIEQDADLVMILHRERDPKSGMFRLEKPPALAIAKGRMDETMVMLLRWEQDRVRFSDCNEADDYGNPLTYGSVYGV